MSFRKQAGMKTTIGVVCTNCGEEYEVTGTQDDGEKGSYDHPGCDPHFEPDNPDCPRCGQGIDEDDLNELADDEQEAAYDAHLEAKYDSWKNGDYDDD